MNLQDTRKNMHHYKMTSGNSKRWYYWMWECQECAAE
jgi:hypothetical protein